MSMLSVMRVSVSDAWLHFRIVGEVQLAYRRHTDVAILISRWAYLPNVFMIEACRSVARHGLYKADSRKCISLLIEIQRE